MSNALHEKPNAEPPQSSGSAGVILNGRYLPPPADEDGKVWVRTSALVQADRQHLYEMWRDVENAPRWQEQMLRVARTGDNTSHWVMRSGAKNTIEWDAEILADEPGHRIAWRSVSGELEQAGQVVFETSLGGRATMVTVLHEFRMGKLAVLWETLVGRSLKRAVIENLRHFKALAETGEIPRTQGQPHGPRGRVAEIKASAYGEKVPTPEGLNRQAS